MTSTTESSSRGTAASACEPNSALILGGVRRGRYAMAICQDLADACGFAGRDASVRRFVLTLGCSRKSVRMRKRRSSSPRRVELHEEAFR